jgi:hypothetical protein
MLSRFPAKAGNNRLPFSRLTTAVLFGGFRNVPSPTPLAVLLSIIAMVGDFSNNLIVKFVKMMVKLTNTMA